jgi:hypothetical protein
VEQVPQEERRQEAARPRRRGCRRVKASAKKSAKKASGAVIDPYLPTSGNFGYRVARYDLDLEYKVAINRLSGSATISAVTLAQLRTFTLDLSPVLIVGKMLVNGKRPR